jgi:ABC-2 type transport system permease protein
MLAHIVAFELRTSLRRISTWAYFALFFALAFVMTSAAGGAWEAFDLGNSRILVNSPNHVASLVAGLGFLAVPVTAALFGNAVYRDFETGAYPLFFTSGVSRAAYLGGRYLGAMGVNLVVLLGIPLAILLASALPHLDAERVGPFRWEAYLYPVAVFTLPNLLFTGALFFSLAALTRQMLPNYVGGVLLLVAYGISKVFINDIDEPWIAGMLDAFGGNPLRQETRYWTVAEQNTRVLPLRGVLLYNRLAWTGVGLAVLAAAGWRFRFSHDVAEWRRRAVSPAGAATPRIASRPLVVPAARRSFTPGARLRQYAAVTGRAFRGIVGNVYFPVLVGALLLFYGVLAFQIGDVYGTTTYPVTYRVIEDLFGASTLFLLVIITFYAGELVWRERELRIHQIGDAMPVPTWIPFVAKLTALAGVVVALLALSLATGVAIQALKGYYRFEPGLYLQELFGRQLVMYLLLCVLALTVQVLVSHKYLGHVVMIVYFIAYPFVYFMGAEHNLFHYGSGGEATYSDMNGYGSAWEPWAWFNLYWAGVALLLAVLSHLFWPRGEETSGRWRLRLARLRATRPALVAAGVAGGLILVSGGFIVYNTTILNEYRTTWENEAGGAEYEKRYGRFEGIPQPRITAARLHVELYPERRDAEVRGVYRLKNRTAVPIDSVHVDLPNTLRVRRFAFSRPARRVLADSAMGYYVFRLGTPLLPGDSLELHFQIAALTRGFANEVEEGGVVHNGTFLNNGMMPTIGYKADGELADDDTRERHGLPPREPMAPPEDLRARMNNDLSHDADWIDFEATVGTSPDQVAVAPGYLQREWREKGRRYFHYRMDAPILNFYAVLSARYRVRRDRWKGVAIEVYHHPGHEYNVERMIRGVKRSLDYFTRNFGPYQHRQVRILEFPRYADFAQSFANTIPYSESVGFIADVEEDDVDYPFFITAHEVAHQWWGHQLVGGNVQGAALLSETLAEYSALMVMEREYGRERMQRFLRFELDGYLRGRAGERRRETPLVRAEGQQYVHYRKGALAMYALRDYLGEARLNAVLARFLRERRFGGPPYPTSLELMAHLRAATPDSLRPVLHDLFETVTLYDLRTREATYTRRPDGKYEVELLVEARKMRADTLGYETEVPVHDLVDVGVFAAEGEDEEVEGPLYLARHRITPETRRIRVVVDRVPARAGIDPYHKLIDRDVDDNVRAVKARGGG